MEDIPDIRKIRRKKRWQGATWTPPSISAAKADGVWCPVHRMFHGYKSAQLVTDYEKRSDGEWRLLWICKMTGSVLGEIDLGQVATEHRTEE